MYLEEALESISRDVGQGACLGSDFTAMVSTASFEMRGRVGTSYQYSGSHKISKELNALQRLIHFGPGSGDLKAPVRCWLKPPKRTLVAYIPEQHMG